MRIGPSKLQGPQLINRVKLTQPLSLKGGGLKTLQNKGLWTVCPAQNQYMQEKLLGELIFARIHAGRRCLYLSENPRAHKNKIGTSPPPPQPPSPPPKKEEFYGHGFPAERTHFFQVSIKLAQPFPAPELRTRILRTRGFF